MARITATDVRPFYATAERLADAALCADDSLFKPSAIA